MFTITVTDHRPGAMGDASTHTVSTYREALNIMREFNCGIATVNDGATEWFVEYDGARFSTFGRELAEQNVHKRVMSALVKSSTPLTAVGVQEATGHVDHILSVLWALDDLVDYGRAHTSVRNGLIVWSAVRS